MKKVIDKYDFVVYSVCSLENLNNNLRKGGRFMKFNYNKLLGLMKEKQITQLELAEKLGITTPTLSLKLNNKARFKQGEIVTICDFLGIDAGSIGSYFFTV